MGFIHTRSVPSVHILLLSLRPCFYYCLSTYAAYKYLFTASAQEEHYSCLKRQPDLLFQPNQFLCQLNLFHHLFNIKITEMWCSFPNNYVFIVNYYVCLLPKNIRIRHQQTLMSIRCYFLFSLFLILKTYSIFLNSQFSLVSKKILSV